MFLFCKPAHRAIFFCQACDKNPTDEHKLDYDEFNPFDICAESYTPIYRGEEKVECPFCTAKFKPEFRERGLLLVELYYTQFFL